LNPGPPDYEVVVLTTRPQRAVVVVVVVMIVVVVVIVAAAAIITIIICDTIYLQVINMNQLIGLMKQAVVACFGILSRSLPEMSEEDHGIFTQRN
jgi:hypothetical protein